MEKDEEYEDLLKAERKARKILKKNNYHAVPIPEQRCGTCKLLECYDAYEDSYGCWLAHNDNWNVCYINEYGVCDKWEKNI